MLDCPPSNSPVIRHKLSTLRMRKILMLQTSAALTLGSFSNLHLLMSGPLAGVIHKPVHSVESVGRLKAKQSKTKGSHDF